MKNIFLAFLALFLCASCSKQVVNTNLNGTNWVLSNWPGENMPSSNKKATLNFDMQQRLNGKSFCNSFNGPFKITGNKITIGEVMTTMMYCDDVADAEQRFSKALRNVNAFQIENGKLQLLKDKEVLLIFDKAE